MSDLRAVYFPGLSFPNSKWLNPALLYFDRIGTICPFGVPENAIGLPTRKLIEAGAAEAISPDLSQMENPNVLNALLHSLITEFGKRRDRLLGPGSYTLMHTGKMSSFSIFESLARERIITKAEDDFYHVPRWLALSFMSFWAIEIAYRHPVAMNIFTNEEGAWNIISKLFQTSCIGNKTDQRMRAVLALLPINKDVSQSEVLEFRKKYKSQLMDFRHYVEVLIHRRDGDLDQDLREAEGIRNGIIELISRNRFESSGPSIFVAIATTAAAVADKSPWSAAAATIPVAMGIANALSEVKAVRDAKRHPLAFSANAKIELRV